MAVDVPTTAHAGASSGRQRPTPAAARLATLFPDAAAPAPTWWRRRRTAIVVALVIALVASGLLAARAFGASGAS